MLNGVHLVDFGNHRNTRLTFGRMTALVGQNGAGKTTVMRAIQRLKPRALKGKGAAIAAEYVRRTAKTAALAGSWPGDTEYGLEDRGVVLRETRTWLCRLRTKEPGDVGWIPDPRTDYSGILPSRMTCHGSLQPRPRPTA